MSQTRPSGRRSSGKSGNIESIPGFGSQKGRRSLGRPPEPAAGRDGHRPLIWGSVALVVVALAVVVVMVQPFGSGPPVARSRQYRDVDACLLTGADGLADPQAAAAWAGLQDVSKQRSIRVSYLPVVGAATTLNARQFVATLVQRNCRAVVAVGRPQTAAVAAAASGATTVNFVVVGSMPAAPNLVPIMPNGQVRTAVAAALERIVGQ